MLKLEEYVNSTVPLFLYGLFQVMFKMLKFSMKGFIYNKYFKIQMALLFWLPSTLVIQLQRSFPIKSFVVPRPRQQLFHLQLSVI